MNTPENHLRLAASEQAGTKVIELAGELDVASAGQLEQELADASPATVVLDLRRLSFMDSTGLRAILTAHDAVQEKGGRLVLVRGGDQVQRLLSLTRVAERLEIVDRPEDLHGSE